MIGSMSWFVKHRLLEATYDLETQLFFDKIQYHVNKFPKNTIENDELLLKYLLEMHKYLDAHTCTMSLQEKKKLMDALIRDLLNKDPKSFITGLCTNYKKYNIMQTSEFWQYAYVLSDYLKHHSKKFDGR